MTYVFLGCAVSLCVTFGASLAGKARRRSFHAFASSAGPLALFPARWRTGLAATTVAAEVTICAGLLAGLLSLRWPASTTAALYAFAGAAMLLAAFTVAIEVSLWRGVRAPCRCFGAGREPLGHGHALRNLLLLAVAVTGASAATAEQVAIIRPAAAGVAVAGGLVAGLLAVRFDDLIHVVGGSAQPSVRSKSTRGPGPGHR